MRQAVLALALALAAAVAAGAHDAFPTDLPTYPHYPLRSVAVLNGTWDFVYVEGGVDVGNLAVLTAMLPKLPFGAATADVPSAFDAAPGPMQYTRGTAFYRLPTMPFANATFVSRRKR
jgi:hypothetical protein